MKEAEYSEATVEVLDILNYTNKEDVANTTKFYKIFN